jgi:hypothetical protein
MIQYMILLGTKKRFTIAKLRKALVGFILYLFHFDFSLFLYPYPLGTAFASIENFFLCMNRYYSNFFPKLPKKKSRIGSKIDGLM